MTAPPQLFRPGRVRLARWIAVGADVLQVLLLPAWLAPPAAAGVNIAIDIAVGVTMCLLLRPHWAFLPAFVVEAVPGVGAIPFWWASVRYVTRQGTTQGDDGLPPAPRADSPVRP